MPGGRAMAVFAGAAGVAAFALAEVLAWSIENETFRLAQLVREDKDDFAQWKRRVDILTGVVGVLHQDSIDLKKGLLVGEIDPAAHAAADEPASAGPPAKRIEADTLLALPKYDSPGAT